MTSGSDATRVGEDAGIVMSRLDLLAQCTDEPGRITRLAFSPALRQANDLVLAWMSAAGMSCRTDAAGNVVGRYEGIHPDAQTLMIGSHLDTMRNGGRFDGPLGVIAGLAVVERLKRQDRRLALAIEVIGFADEEGVRFGRTILGSEAMAGKLDSGWQDLCDQDGVTAGDAVCAFGIDPEGVKAASRCENPPLAYVELHIEQGPVLEDADTPLGCVTQIAGATRLAVTIDGIAGHAGTVPMRLRHDALAAAAECVLAVERLCSGEETVGTVGRLHVDPNAGNVIPGQVSFSVDIRAARDTYRLARVKAVTDAFQAIARRRGVELAVRTSSESHSTPCSPDMIAITAETLAGMGLPAIRLASGAGHDGIAMSAISPIGMLFVRCAGGISHNPAEHVSTADIEAGIEALYRVCLSACGEIPIRRSCRKQKP